MTNLANDVACKVVNPITELKRLYPNQPNPTDVDVATAALYTHHTQERSRTVNAHIPTAFWAGPEVLRAMAQYLREPLFVLDVTQTNDAHVQNYYYKDYILPNGDTHETGCGGAMDDATAKRMLHTYAGLHVLPVFIVLKRHEGHFYGVKHGDLYTRWQAEGDLTFAQDHCADYDWFNDVIAHMDDSEARQEDLDPLVDTDEGNAILIGTVDRRDRLDIAHDRLKLARLDSCSYDMDILAGGLRAEGVRLQALANKSDAGTEVAGPSGNCDHGGPPRGRASISQQGRVSYQVLQRILDSEGQEPELMSDRRKLRQLCNENTAALHTWLHRGRIPRLLAIAPGRQPNLLRLMPELLADRRTLHELFAFLPYLEIAVKMMPGGMALQWGELEVYDAQVDALREVIADAATGNLATEYCRTWLAACTSAGGSTRDRQVAREPDRWRRLTGLYLDGPTGVCPADIEADCWKVLHLLPHVAWSWAITPWGQTAAGRFGGLYHAHPIIQRVCEQVAEHAAWGEVVTFPSGVTWEDRLAAMAAGQSPQVTY
ncbi:hypothetical protein PR003_g23020 [Phytophthora rubi]|uniref:Uncharacterized protein n=1 Tax=Phytophthora rubi TaxID=129364 RepID=A0A6A4D510_9STRA|nr:hypothetical protein PR002_g22439 [Phytophthora rubi]KAE9007059.1 hypothetical protein PR001_g17057 [Phytophthora rubi]KAE9299354.1 hypothetical protein PR003_g23020 [Phytophthora rubi]